MAEIKPFQAVVYNQRQVRSLAEVTCPPYDVISPSQQEYFHQLSPHNFIHILFGRDIPGEDKYERAAKLFRQWQEEKLLIQEDSPAVYFYSQDYLLRGEKRTRLGFIALLRLEEGNKAAFAHEHTRLAPKEDRLRLLRQVKANLSPIFIVFADKKRIISRTFRRDIQDRDAAADFTDNEKVRHKLWRVDSPEVIAAIAEALRREDVFIADVHHRYEVACAFRDEMRRANPQGAGEAPFNYLMAYFTNPDPRGLAIFAIHRLLPFAKEPDTARKEGYFDIEEVKDKARFLFLMEKGGCNEHVIGMYRGGRFFLLRLKNLRILDKIMADNPRPYRQLDVSILNAVILDDVLACTPEEKEAIRFSHHEQEVFKEVDAHPGYTAFFLNPVKFSAVQAVALAGSKMPPKSTYFYPKVVSGLVINKLE